MGQSLQRRSVSVLLFRLPAPGATGPAPRPQYMQTSAPAAAAAAAANSGLISAASGASELGESAGGTALALANAAPLAPSESGSSVGGGVGLESLRCCLRLGASWSAGSKILRDF